MARPARKGLDYFPLDCHLDNKFEMVEAAFGLKGFALVIKLLQKIYGENGYYIEWSQDVELVFAHRNCESVNLVSEVVKDCLKRGIFNKEMYEKHGILTSKGIQERYLFMTSKRTSSKISDDYILLNEHKKTVKSEKTNVFGEKTNVYYGKNTTKESKVNKSKVNKSKYCNNAASTVFEIFENEFGRPLSQMEYEMLISLQKEHSSDLIKRALKEAVMNNAKNFKYIQAILNSWKTAGIKTVDEAEEQIQRFKNGNARIKNQNQKQLPEWYHNQDIVKTDTEDFEEAELLRQMEKLRGELE